ncbi:MAG: 50S ribosomal protein L17 [bacterium]|nr:50S ribosomal protein L17 [bacterium]
MRHSNQNRKFGREEGQRKALLKSLIANLIRDEKITTTEAKAKEMRSFVEKLVTRAKVDSLASRRLLKGRLGTDFSVSRLINEIAPKYKTRAGGYTRIVKLPTRKSDGARMAIIEFV